MRQAIITKFIGPTNTKGSRIKASCEAGSVTIGWDTRLNSDMNHLNAAKTLQAKLGWNSDLIVGGYKNQYVFVQKDN